MTPTRLVLIGLAVSLTGCAAFDEWVPVDYASADNNTGPEAQCVGYANIGPGGTDRGRPLAEDGYSTWTGATRPCSEVEARRQYSYPGIPLIPTNNSTP
tara:strand:- start:38453 stop:38749 length:297 start_codon:yes stop_codon:yes gene_type:complete